MLQALQSALMVALIGLSSAAKAAESEGHAALAAALKNAKGTLEAGLKAGERVGKHRRRDPPAPSCGL